MISRSATSSRFDRAYWQKTPHAFVPAHWGPKYCDLCLDPKRRVIHLKWGTDEERLRDPRSNLMPRGYPISRRSDHTWYRIEGWNDDNDGSCSYGMGDDKTFDDCVEIAKIMKVSGDGQGQVYDHYTIVEVYEYTVADTNYHTVEELM